MTPLSLTVNGQAVAALVEPRTHLADFLREQLNLTGTHLGCEQGVCGACTVLIDGRPQRACLALAVDCEAAAVTTIEGLDDDPVMAALREAFTAHHALQCGFCTPGMLTIARDMVLRLGEMPERRIREELSGNLCRCTGYVGIVAAVGAVAKGRLPQPPPAVQATASIVDRPVRPEPVAAPIAAAAPVRAAAGPGLRETIRIAAPPETVWTALADLRGVAECLPGAEIDTIDGDRLTGRMRLALGPIRVAFAGEGAVALDPAARRGRLSGRGRDKGSGSSAEGELAWQVLPADGGSKVEIELSWRLTGLLAQFNRAALVRDVVRHMTASFAAALEAKLAGRARPPARPPGVFALLWAVLKARLLGR